MKSLHSLSRLTRSEWMAQTLAAYAQKAEVLYFEAWAMGHFNKKYADTERFCASTQPVHRTHSEVGTEIEEYTIYAHYEEGCKALFDFQTREELLEVWQMIPYHKSEPYDFHV